MEKILYQETVTSVLLSNYVTLDDKSLTLEYSCFLIRKMKGLNLINMSVLF